MKIYAQGALLGPDKLTAADAMGYVVVLKKSADSDRLKLRSRHHTVGGNLV
jgi:hypothetical protein